MPIEKLQIKNFQVHKKLDIDLDPHINTFLGSSDVGKSAIIRAIRLIATNKPSGDAYVKDIDIGKKNKCEVSFKIDNNTVKRVRSASKNLYVLNSKEFNSFGYEVPEEILELLCLSYDVNFQGQHDNAFWISKTAGEVSRELNKIVNLDAIDNISKYLKAKTRKSKNKLDVIDERLDDIKVERKKLRYVKKLNKDLVELEAKQQKAQETAENRVDLHEVIINMQSLISRVKVAKELARKLFELQKLGKKWVVVADQRKNCKFAINKYKRLYKKVDVEIPNIDNLLELTLKNEVLSEDRKKLSKLIKQTQDLFEVVNPDNIPDITDLLEKEENWETLLERRKQLSSIIDNNILVNKNQKTRKREIKKLETQLKEIFKEGCPVCGISDKCLHCGEDLR